MSFRDIKFLLFLVLIFSCQPYKDSPIVGEWNAALIKEAHKSETLNPETRNYLFFTSSGDYIFENELNQNEKGSFDLKDSLLTTKDISKNPPVERRMKVLTLTTDSLILEMKTKYGHINKVLFLRINREDVQDTITNTLDSVGTVVDSQDVVKFNEDSSSQTNKVVALPEKPKKSTQKNNQKASSKSAKKKIAVKKKNKKRKR